MGDTYLDGVKEGFFSNHSATAPINAAFSMVQRAGGRLTTNTNLNITGTGALSANVFQVHGSVEVIEQWGEITAVTTLTNATAVYGDLWDGTVSEPLTAAAPGATLSGAPVGTIVIKNQLKTAAMGVSIADQCRVLEAQNRIAVPFIVTQKNGADTFIRFNLTTTDAPIDFTFDVYFVWRPLDGGHIEAV
jgi:hypothetical protein